MDVYGLSKDYAFRSARSALKDVRVSTYINGSFYELVAGVLPPTSAKSEHLLEFSLRSMSNKRMVIPMDTTLIVPLWSFLAAEQEHRRKAFDILTSVAEEYLPEV